jgi:hypothetical protein
MTIISETYKMEESYMQLNDLELIIPKGICWMWMSKLKKLKAKLKKLTK